MKKSTKHQARAHIMELAARPEGIMVSELSKLTGQAHRTAHAYLRRLAKEGELFHRVGCYRGEAVGRYWLNEDHAKAWALDPIATPPVKGVRGKVTASIRFAILAGATNHTAICDAIGHHCREVVVAMCGRMVARGEIFRADDLDARNHHCYRYFTSAEARDEWAAQNDIQARRKEIQETERERRRQRARETYYAELGMRPPAPSKSAVTIKTEVKASKQTRSVSPAPVNDPDFSQAKRTISAPMPDRWAVEIPPQGGLFSSLKPGQYAFEANTCAARAAA